MASFTTQTPTFYEISWRHGQISKEVQIGSRSTLLAAQQGKNYESGGYVKL